MINILFSYSNACYVCLKWLKFIIIGKNIFVHLHGPKYTMSKNGLVDIELKYPIPNQFSIFNHTLFINRYYIY